MEVNRPFALFADCILVNGAQRSMLLDLGRREYSLIPNALYEILNRDTGLTIQAVVEKYGDENKSIIIEYFQFLIDKEFIFFVEESQLQYFPKTSNFYAHPAEVSNAIIDFNEALIEHYESVFSQLQALGCYNVQLRFFDEISRELLHKILDKTLYKDFVGIELIVPFFGEITNEEDLAFLKYPINQIIVYNAPNEIVDRIDESEIITNIVYYRQTIMNEKNCGLINPSYFTINITTFNESLAFNSCLNKKISIDYNGFIKNCPSMVTSYGNIVSDSLDFALNQVGFKRLWNITKDQVLKCKDCEFRRVCTDCRAYIDNPQDLFSAPLKCGYDPYTCNWEEWTEHPLKQLAMQFYDLNTMPD